MNKAMEIYTELKDKLGEVKAVTPVITMQEYTEGSWNYVFLFCRGEFKKVEAYNHREFIELWNK